MAPTSSQLAVAVDAARAAGLLLREQFGLPQQIEHKGEIDLVTALDRRAESLVLWSASERPFPTTNPGGTGHLWGQRPGPLARRSPRRDDELRARVSVFRRLIAYEHAGRVVVGVIYDPLPDELFVAEAGEGAWPNGRRSVSATTRLVDSLLITGFPYARALFPAALRLWDAFMCQAQAVRRAGAVALDLAYVAAGRAEGSGSGRCSPGTWRRARCW